MTDADRRKLATAVFEEKRGEINRIIDDIIDELYLNDDRFERLFNTYLDEHPEEYKDMTIGDFDDLMSWFFSRLRLDFTV